MKKNNKGFSLVELIVVIAIMIVLVAVLAPVFTKYVERSRRATDVQNANTIAEAVLVEVADNGTNTDTKKGIKAGEDVKVDADSIQGIAAISSVPKVKGNKYDSADFYYNYDSSANTVKVFVGTSSDTDASGDLTDDDISTKYGDPTKDND